MKINVFSFFCSFLYVLLFAWVKVMYIILKVLYNGNINGILQTGPQKDDYSR